MPMVKKINFIENFDQSIFALDGHIRQMPYHKYTHTLGRPQQTRCTPLDAKFTLGIYVQNYVTAQLFMYFSACLWWCYLIHF